MVNGIYESDNGGKGSLLKREREPHPLLSSYKTPKLDRILRLFKASYKLLVPFLNPPVFHSHPLLTRCVILFLSVGFGFVGLLFRNGVK